MDNQGSKRLRVCRGITETFFSTGSHSEAALTEVEYGGQKNNGEDADHTPLQSTVGEGRADAATSDSRYGSLQT
jgi:hypothetical protein